MINAIEDLTLYIEITNFSRKISEGNICGYVLLSM